MIAERDEQLAQLIARVNSLMEMINNRNANAAGTLSPQNTSNMTNNPLFQSSPNDGTTTGATSVTMTYDAMLQAIANIISKKLEELGAYAKTTSHNYVKPYSVWHDDVPFPMGYHQPKFKEFNGTGCPHKHIVHFLLACGDIARNNSLLIRQFVRPLKGASFEWYSKLGPDSIPDWDTMKSQTLSLCPDSTKPRE
jgi:hypothetical protein